MFRIEHVRPESSRFATTVACAVIVGFAIKLCNQTPPSPMASTIVNGRRCSCCTIFCRAPLHGTLAIVCPLVVRFRRVSRYVAIAVWMATVGMNGGVSRFLGIELQILFWWNVMVENSSDGYIPFEMKMMFALSESFAMQWCHRPVLTLGSVVGLAPQLSQRLSSWLHAIRPGRILSAIARLILLIPSRWRAMVWVRSMFSWSA